MLLTMPFARDSATAELDASSNEAWNELVRRHERRVLLSLVARGASIHLARDIAQQAWMRVFDQHARGRLETLELPGIVLRQADFLLRDHRRRAAHEVGEERAEAAFAPDGPLLARDALARIQKALGELPRGQQRIFWAVYERPDASHAEVAASLGISVQHLRQTLSEVRGRLRALLEDDRHG